MSDLLGNPRRYEFHQAMRLLEQGRVPGITGRPVGHDNDPQYEVVRLHASTSLGFPKSAIEAIRRRKGDERRVDVTIAFLGALGACGALPWHYTEYVYAGLARRDRSLRDFVAALEHRSLSLHHRAWRKHRLAFAYEAARTAGSDDVTGILRALVGLGTDHLRERVREGEAHWLYFAGLFGTARRTTAGLASMLEALCGHPVTVQEFVGRWQRLVPEERSRLGGPPGPATANLQNELGGTLMLGDRVWDVLSSVRIRIGPLPAAATADLQQAGLDGWLEHLVRSYLGPDVDFEILGLVDPATIRPMALGGDARLGGASWLASSDQASYAREVFVCSSR